MKRIRIYILLISLFTIFSTQAQQTFSREDIVGRWVGGTELRPDSSIVEDRYTYIFRENDIFHIGEAFDGVILFNITGKYYIKNNIIFVSYLDMLSDRKEKKQLIEIPFKIVTIKNNRMNLLIKDSNYEYNLFLNKQQFSK